MQGAGASDLARCATGDDAGVPVSITWADGAGSLNGDGEGVVGGCADGLAVRKVEDAAHCMAFGDGDGGEPEARRAAS